MERRGVGRTPGFTEVELDDEDTALPGEILRARTIGYNDRRLLGERVTS
jgi:hypothetical protein